MSDQNLRGRGLARPSRRRVLAQAAAGATMLAARAAFPGGVWAATADAPETTKAVFGFIALTDAASVIMAYENRFFEKRGINVQLQKMASWPATRDSNTCSIRSRAPASVSSE